MYVQSEYINRDRKYKIVANRKHRSEEYNNWTGKFKNRVQHQTRSSGRKDWLTKKQGNGVHSVRGAKEKGIKKSEHSLRNLKDINKQINIHITGVPNGERWSEVLFKEIMTEKFFNLEK